MARIPQRLRYEVLRRDGFTCRYCGAAPPATVLHVDHIIPDVLGGSIRPENLVTACADCNAGKATSMPNAATVVGPCRRCPAPAEVGDLCIGCDVDEWRSHELIRRWGLGV